MKSLFFLLLFPVLSFAQAEMIRVRIVNAISEVTLSGVGIRYNGESQFQKIAIPTNKQLKIKMKSAEFLVSESFGEKSVEAPYLMIRGSELMLNGKRVPDNIILTNKKVAMDVVAMMDVESYLLGVVASEVPSNWPLETLKAQAIVARTYAMATIRERWNKVFHVESTVMDQVFRHIANEEKNQLKNVVLAVTSTKGQYLADSEALPIKAYFHADCGGVTADAKEVWGGTSTEVVVDSGCGNAKGSEWNFYIGKSELAAKIAMLFREKADLQIEKVDIIKNSARVSEIKITLNNGSIRLLSADQLRSLLGYNLLKSAMFQIKETVNGFSFNGKGHGHGVGLCQWGSKKLGSEGKNHQEILTHYYPKAKLLVSNNKFAEFKTEQSLLKQTR